MIVKNSKGFETVQEGLVVYISGGRSVLTCIADGWEMLTDLQYNNIPQTLSS